MIEILRRLFISEVIDYAKLVNEGAIVLDVRDKSDFKKKHLKGSVNIPLNNLQNNLHLLNQKNRVILTCCDSGIKSKTAKSLLKINGYSNVFDGGEWQSLHNKLIKNESSLL